MTFGWEGFSLSHPEDWAPAALSGDRNQGYARIASPGRLMLQIRWRRLKGSADTAGFLDDYLGRLRRDAKRAGIPFTSSRESEASHVGYRYSGAANGRGVVLPASDGRTFVIEVVASKGDVSPPILREAIRTFSTDEATDRWSAFGLDLTLPRGLKLERRNFLAGKTTLDWRGRGVRLHAERWGLADQLLARHDLADWARAVLGTERATVWPEDDGIRLALAATHRPAMLATLFLGAGEAIVRHQADRNQIVVVRTWSRDPRWRPDWDWLN